MPSSASRTSTAAATPAAPGLADPELRRFLHEYVKKRVSRGDVDDVVQTVLLDALAAKARPEDPAELRKWVVGIARHKCADTHRRSGRERPADEELPDQPAAPSPIEERSLVRWAEEQAQSTNEAGKTLDWMAREGEGDKLEHIAEEEKLPPARVRQRVSRMRRFLKERWLAEVALVAALGAMAVLVWAWLRKEDEPIVADPTKPPEAQGPREPTLPELDRLAEGRRIRTGALEVCKAGEDQRCIDGLDRARELDEAGEEATEVREAREKAAGNLRDKARDNEIDQKQQKSAPPPPPPETTNLDSDSKNVAPTKAPPAPAPSDDRKVGPKKPPAPRSKGNGKESVIDLEDSGSLDDVPPLQPTAPTAPPPNAPPSDEKRSSPQPQQQTVTPPTKSAPEKAAPKKATVKPQAPTFTAPPSQKGPSDDVQQQKGSKK